MNQRQQDNYSQQQQQQQDQNYNLGEQREINQQQIDYCGILGQQQSQQIDYEDALEDARRQEVLRNINQFQGLASIQEKHEDLQQLLQRKAKRQDRKQVRNKQNQMKKLRQQNALQFFKKVKIIMLKNFKDSIQTVKAVQYYQTHKLHRLFSFFNMEILTIYQSLYSRSRKNQQSIKRKQFYDFITKIFESGCVQLKGDIKYQAIWAMAEQLGLGFRKLSFIDISDMQLQTFYNLRYDEGKGKKKKLSKQIDILKNKLQRKATQQQLSNKSYISLDSYAFNPNMLKPNIASQPQTQSSNSQSLYSLQNYTLKSQKLRQMKKTFTKSYCQIYCPYQDNWQIYNLQTLQTQQIKQLKHSILDTKAIIGFYSTHILKYNKKYQQMKNYRKMRDILFKDHNIELCDKYQIFIKRQYRLGCKSLYKSIIKQCNIFKNMQIFIQFQKILIQKQNIKQLQWAKQHFPKSIRQMRISDYFIIPSLVDKYLIIKQNAISIPNIQFHEQKVYYKKDLQKVSSRMGWIDYGRMVKQGQIPVKTTENKNKISTKLYKFNQTQPFYIKFNKQGQFILDQQYNSIYVPPQFNIPQGYILIPENVQYLCKKNKYKCARIVQGFDIAGMHVVPNNIGFLVQQKYKQEIQHKYKEKQQKLRLKKQEKKIDNALSLWRKLFKSIIITQQVHKQF